jgi:hypothetical protein
VCFFIFCTALAIKWRNIADMEGRSGVEIEDEEMLKPVRDSEEIELSTFVKFSSGPLDTTTIEEI